jgi:hypothetical protein
MEIGIQETMKELLARHKSKNVTIRLTSGSELAGVLEQVGDEVLHLTKLTGMEFFDAVIRLDTVAALIIRTRTK